MTSNQLSNTNVRNIVFFKDIHVTLETNTDMKMPKPNKHAAVLRKARLRKSTDPSTNRTNCNNNNEKRNNAYKPSDMPV